MAQLFLAPVLGFAPGCSDSVQDSLLEGDPLLLDGVLAQRPQNGPLVGNVGGISPITVIAPDALRAGEHFTIRIGSQLRPGGPVYGSAIVHVKDASEAYVLSVQPFPSPEGQGIGDYWSLDIRGQISPELAGDQRVYEIEIGLIDANGLIGPIQTWSPLLIPSPPAQCPESAACLAAQCGFESVCGTYCGPLEGACAPGFVCSADQFCLPVGPACPAAATCDGRECGYDPVCGVSCGTCPSGISCSDDGQCLSVGTSSSGVDTSSTDTGIGDDSSDSTDETDTTECSAGQITCDGNCINPQTDPRYCGAFASCMGTEAGVVCDVTERCEAGACVLNCAGGSLECGGACVDPDNDPMHCGATKPCADYPGETCDAGEVCSLGVCSDSCATWEVLCNGRCIDPESDNQYCGAAADCAGINQGRTCVGDEVCSGGLCRIECSADEVECFDACIDPDTDADYCGAKGDCTGENQGMTCNDGEICDDGACQVACTGSKIACGGKCIDPDTDLNYCGATADCAGSNAGAKCKSGERCEAGTCKNPCPVASQVLCGGVCIDPQNHDTYCGAKLDCAGSNAGVACGDTASCNAGICVPDCMSPNIVCGISCIDPSSDERFCGASDPGCTGGDSCESIEDCVEGSCVTNCGYGLIACDGMCVDPKSDERYCGATAPLCTGGVVCEAGILCIDGKCEEEMSACKGDLSFEDRNLDAAVRKALGKPSGALGLADVAKLESLIAPSAGIKSLAGLDCWTQLKTLKLNDNGISKIDPLVELSALVELELQGNLIRELEPLAGLKNLQHLRLDRNQITTIDALSKLDVLRELGLHDNDISKLGPLAELRQLEVLNLSTNNVSDLAALKSLTKLTQVDLQGNPLADLAQLAELTNMSFLRIDNVGVSDLSFLKSMRGLKSLYAFGNKIKDISPLSELTKLEHLALGGNPLSSLKPLSKLTSLQDLYLNECGLTNLDVLSGLLQLKALYLGRNSISDLAPLAKLSQLETLIISSNDIGSLSPLSGLRKLKSLQASETGITDLGPLKALALEQLGVGGNGVRDLRPLSAMVTLRALSLYSNLITDIGPLAKLSNLKTLELQNNKIACVDEQRSVIKQLQENGCSVTWDEC